MTHTRNPDNTYTVDANTLETLAELALVDELRTLARPFHGSERDKQARVALARDCAAILGFEIQERLDTFSGKFTDRPDHPAYVEMRERLYDAFGITEPAV